MVGATNRQWYRMTTAEVLDALSVDPTIGVIDARYRGKNIPYFIPKPSWPMYKYSVRRNGVACKITIDQLCVGDCIFVSAGDVVPANIRLLRVASLRVQEQSMHGYAGPTFKHTLASKSLLPKSQQRNMLFAGTHIMSGSALGIIIAGAQDDNTTTSAKNLRSKTYTKKQINLKMMAAKRMLRKVDTIFFDDLQQTKEIMDLIQQLYMKKGIVTTFFVQPAIATQLEYHLPSTVFSAKAVGVRVLVGYSEQRKSRCMAAAHREGSHTLYVHRGATNSYISKVADIDMVIAQHASQIAIQRADIVAWRMTVRNFSRILYNKK